MKPKGWRKRPTRGNKGGRKWILPLTPRKPLGEDGRQPTKEGNVIYLPSSEKETQAEDETSAKDNVVDLPVPGKRR